MSFQIDTKEVDALARQLSGAEPIIHQEMLAGMTRVALTIEGTGKELVPVKSGHLRRSISHNITAQGASIVARVGTNVPYAIYVEEGRGPVEAGPGRMLRFEIGGQVFYRKRVGPAKAKPFMKPALTQNRARIVAEFSTAVPRRIVQRLGLA